MQKNWEVTLQAVTLASPWIHVCLCACKLILTHVSLFRTQKALSFIPSPSYILEKTYSSWWSDSILTETNVNSKCEKLGLQCWLFLRPGVSACFCLSANLSMPLSVLTYQQQQVSSQPLSELQWHSEVICFKLPSLLSVGYVSDRDHRMPIVRAMQKH